LIYFELLWSLKLLHLWNQTSKRKTLKAYRKQIRLALYVGDIYPPGPLEGERSLREASGRLPHKAISSWTGQKLLVEWVGPRR
jgi:hypothetical protein